MEMSVNSIYQWLWQLLHFLVSLYEICLWVRLRVIAFALWSYDLCQTQTKRNQSECDFLKQCKKQLTKIPKHINLIIGPEAQTVNEELLARIFTYALYMNIECISFYDTRPESCKRAKRISLHKVKCPEGWKSKSLEEHRAVWYSNSSNNGLLSNGSNQLNGCVPTSLSSNCSKSSNGHITPISVGTKSLQIYQIQPSDNRPLIAQVCRSLFRERHTTEVQDLLNQRSQLTDRLDKELSKELHNLSEPELSIIFAENFCTYGMLPWHTRFTEFQRHETGKRFDVESFAHILYTYSRCEQRWGK